VDGCSVTQTTVSAVKKLYLLFSISEFICLCGRNEDLVFCCIQECIPTLASFISLHADNAVQLAALQALTNLSVTSTYLSQLTPFLGSVVDTATNSTSVKLTLQSLCLLANLTCSSEFVDQLLKYQVSSRHI